MTIQQLALRLERLSLSDNSKAESPLPGLSIYRASDPTHIEAMIYEPIVCLIVQGEKETTVGDHTVLLQEGHYVVVGHDLPVLARITKASAKKPYLSLIIRIDLNLIRTLEDVLDDFEWEPETPRSLTVSPVSETLLDVLARYLSLPDDPLEAKVLYPLFKKELHFRLLMSPAGGMLRALANRESHASNIGRAIGLLRKNYRKSLDVNELARSVGMSPSSFHRHFKSMTMTTPLQYQKDLRLTEARRLFRTGETSVSSVAFDVGYESPSQFSREYSRKFGASPRVDLQVV
jgi:AraC-like DNA-binding protein